MKYSIKHEWIDFTIDSLFHQKTIEDFLNYFHCSKKNKSLFIHSKEILLNNKEITLDTILNEKDHLKIKAYKHKEIDYLSQRMDLDILYEDEFILIVDKPAGIIVHPESKDELDTLCNGLAYYYELNDIHKEIRYIHRLDKDTRGLMMICKCPLIQPLLDYQLKEKDIKRYYLAIVEGIVNNKKWMKIDAPIGKDRHVSNKMRVSKTGLDALTYYRSLDCNKKYSLVECHLDTGRTHQIRVHLSSMKHPILHDPIYGKQDTKTLALQAYKLEFIHPITLKPLSITLNKKYWLRLPK